MKQHHMSQTKLYRTFHHLRDRCRNPKNPSYHKYGAKGIRCEWESFQDFRKDMEESFNKHVAEHGEKNTSIDRVDSKGNYSKDNCRWATYLVQNENRSNTRFYEIDGITRPLGEWIRMSGLNRRTVWTRLNQVGWDIKRALTEPPSKTRKRERDGNGRFYSKNLKEL